MTRHYLLYFHEGAVRAAEYMFDPKQWPKSLRINGTDFPELDDGSFFMFWDELRDSEGGTIGYHWNLVEQGPTFRASRFMTESCNVHKDGEEFNGMQDIHILLKPCPDPVWACVQGFGSSIHVSAVDPRDCVVLMYDWDDGNEKVFPLHPIAIE